MLSTAARLTLLQRTKKGIETIQFAKFWQKGVEIRHFPRFCSSIGVETKQTFHRPEKRGSNGGAYVVFIKWVPSLGPDRLFNSKSLFKTIPHYPRKATKLTIVNCFAIWYETQQQCCRFTCNIWKRTYVLFVYLIKSPRYTGGWLYVFVPVRTPPPARPPPPPPAADSCPRDNFWTTFWISFIFSTIVGPDL